MTPPKHVRDADRPNRAHLLLGLAVALVCASAGVASAQTTVPADEGTTTTTTQDAVDGLAEPAAPAGSEDPAATGATDAGEPATPPEDTATDDGADEASAGGKRNRGSLRLLREDTTPHTIFFAGQREAKFEYKFAGARNADLNVEVIKEGKDQLIKRWHEKNVPSDKKQTIKWNGRRSNGERMHRGHFYFRVHDTDGKALNRKRASGKRTFSMWPAIFPVRGKHQYWDGFGAGRGHQGQDVGANCGTEMVAAEAGEVVYKGYDGGGYGNYLIINPRGQSHAEVYGHLKRPAKPRQGASVMTGERIGFVGETGNAQGCHLHFEYWHGSYPGGHATAKVTKRLKSWDHWS